MQAVIRGSRVGLRATRGVRCQLGRAAGSGGPIRRPQQAGLCSSAQPPAGRPVGGAPEPRRSVFRTFSSGSGGGVGGSGGGGGGGGGGSGKGGSSGGLWAAYLSLLDRKPLATKAVSAGVLNGVGDAIAQLIFEKDGKFDWKRLGIFTFLGVVLIGPALHFWYGTLGSLVKVAGTKGTLLKMACDQLGFAPIFLSTIIGFLMTLEGHAAEVPAKLKQDLFTILKSNWMLWVPFQFINFGFVPGHLQVLASNVCALGWNTYMSWATHKKVDKPAAA